MSSSQAALVSVIIPAFNAASTLAETIASVSAQSWRALEIFVIDDGSTDSTPDIIAAAARDDPRITAIRQRNQGVGAARNAGLVRASGSYAAWLDADDLWHPDKIARQIDVFLGAPEPLGFVYTGHRIIDSDGRIQPNPRTVADISGRTLLRQIATTYFTHPSSIMAPVALARACGGHDPSLRAAGLEGAEDLLLQLRLANRGPVGLVPEALVGYRIHGSNMSRAVARAARSNALAYAKLEAEGVAAPEWVWRLGHGRMAGFALQMLASGNPGPAWDFLQTLLSRAPAETLAVLARSVPFLVRDRLGLRPRDPALGQKFADADPASAPIEGHMLLSPRAEARIRAADRKWADSQAAGLAPDRLKPAS